LHKALIAKLSLLGEFFFFNFPFCLKTIGVEFFFDGLHRRGQSFFVAGLWFGLVVVLWIILQVINVKGIVFAKFNVIIIFSFIVFLFVDVNVNVNVPFNIIGKYIFVVNNNFRVGKVNVSFRVIGELVIDVNILFGIAKL